ncbi:MAG: leucyl/phenylalanyl-tRNA--protein transferase [Gammaproteobacteria bacterium]|nr:MAG: leucyl/phenylalanyl-tRNA--protein transferase [Gammaproteobacteria bacterium]RLA53231.1 MAG: leucyl/phenylalanyl-tRNA--protein transferase [Gammaproteobacteria bacterium]
MADSVDELAVLDTHQPIFPDPRQALVEPNGLLAVGGNLEPETLIKAYRAGIFPWFERHQPILWWSPNPRAVIYPEQLHLSRSLRKILRRGDYEVTTDCAFTEVIQACSARGNKEEGTWITDEMIAAYSRLFDRGVAHSVEYWHDGALAGGLYGIAAGRVFCGESMFSQSPNASKIALAHLANALQHSGFLLIDCQIGNDHLASLGAVSIDREQFLDLLNNNIEARISWPAKEISAKLFSRLAMKGRA